MKKKTPKLVLAATLSVSSASATGLGAMTSFDQAVQSLMRVAQSGPLAFIGWTEGSMSIIRDPKKPKVPTKEKASENSDSTVIA